MEGIIEILSWLNGRFTFIINAIILYLFFIKCSKENRSLNWYALTISITSLSLFQYFMIFLRERHLYNIFIINYTMPFTITYMIIFILLSYYKKNFLLIPSIFIILIGLFLSKLTGSDSKIAFEMVLFVNGLLFLTVMYVFVEFLIKRGSEEFTNDYKYIFIALAIYSCGNMLYWGYFDKVKYSSGLLQLPYNAFAYYLLLRGYICLTKK